MRVADLDLRELLSFDSSGVIRSAGQRALLLDAVALGLLRSELIRTLGMTAARGILTRFGYAHGFRTAESLKTQFPWDSEQEWRLAGARLHSLQGLVVNTPSTQQPANRELPPEAIWHDSYEAEQHLLQLGQADEPVCWTLTGFVSGYTSYAYGRQAYAIEDKCRAKGDAVCRVVGTFREDGGQELAGVLPFYDAAGLETTLGHLSDELKRLEKQLRTRRKALESSAATENDPSGLVAQSTAMRKVLDLTRRVAQVDTTVLITGESGVGKERIARLIHDESTRTGGAFVAINCGALPENLLESELFGHVKGAFTGAAHDRPGLFEAANRGTLFLDEIGEVSPAMQVKLLRALQEREVRRVGENKTRSVDVRVLAATNRDLLAEVNAGRFRQDLYYRLRVVEVRIPPLRERREDILPLARRFLAAAAQRLQRKPTAFSPAAASQLTSYAWPGNVRELENAIERAVVLAGGSRIDVEDLPEELLLAAPEPQVPREIRPLEEVERNYIMAVVRANGGNKVKAAEQLEIGTATLYRKLKKYESAKRAR